MPYDDTWNPFTGINQGLGQGMKALGAAAQVAQERATQDEVRQQASYSDPFKRHLERVLTGGADPRQAALELKAELAGAPVGAPDMHGGHQMRGAVALGMPAAPQGLGAVGVNMPQPMAEMRRPAIEAAGNPSLAPLAYRGDQTGMQRPAPQPMPERMLPAPQPAEPFLQTNADVQGALSLAPYMTPKKVAPKGPGRDYVGEIRARGEEARKTEGVRQEGRVTLADMRNAERQLEQARKIAFDADVLDERTSHHLDTIRLGYAALRARSDLLDRTLDYKRTAGEDQKLKAAVKTVGDMAKARVELVASAFASTPEGQRTIEHLDDVLGTWQPLLIEYGNGTVPVQNTGGSTTTVKKTEKKADAGGQQGAQPPPAGPKPKVRFKLKADTSYGKKGQTGSVTEDKFDAAVMERIP